VVACYDAEPRRFYVVKGAARELEKAGKKDLEAEELEALPGMADMSEKLIFAHELTHALQDESLKLDKRMKSLKDNGDRALALESLLEGEATLVMVRVVMADLPGADEGAEEMLEPLLTAGAPRRTRVPQGNPHYLVGPPFFPDSAGAGRRPRGGKCEGRAGV